MSITYDDFCRVDLRSGIVINALEFPKAKKPALQIWVDFGPLGIKKTSAQVTKHYTPKDLIGRRVIGCVNLPPRNIAGFISEFLLTGFADEHGDIRLAEVHSSIPLGQKLH
jgi:tRNA-binding protein